MYVASTRSPYITGLRISTGKGETETVAGRFTPKKKIGASYLQGSNDDVASCGAVSQSHHRCSDINGGELAAREDVILCKNTHVDNEWTHLNEMLSSKKRNEVTVLC